MQCCHRQNSLSAVQPRRRHMSTSSLGLPCLPLVSRLGDSCFCVGILGCCSAACSGGLALLPALRGSLGFGCTAALCGPATGPDSRDTRRCLLPAMHNAEQLLVIHASVMRLRPGCYLPWPPLALLPLLPAATLQHASASRPFSFVGLPCHPRPHPPLPPVTSAFGLWAHSTLSAASTVFVADEVQSDAMSKSKHVLLTIRFSKRRTRPPTVKNSRWPGACFCFHLRTA